jgi:hypothetical protein
MSDKLAQGHAEALFDGQGADVTIRSSNNVNFRTFKLLLSLASPVFNTMFGLPQPDTNGEKDVLPVVPVSEPSRTVEMLLKLLHPKCSLFLDNVDDAVEMLEMSKKYDMEGVAEHVQEALKRMLRQRENDPIRAYAVASRFQIEEEATIAAKTILKLSNSEIFGLQHMTELKYMTGLQLQTLYNYHYRCGQAAAAVATTSAWMPLKGVVQVVWADLNHPCCSPDTTSSLRSVYYSNPPKLWWAEYMRESSAALSTRPHAISITKPELVQGALKKASACSSCRNRAFEEMPKFLEVYVAEVERVVSKVSHSYQTLREREIEHGWVAGCTRTCVLITVGIGTGTSQGTSFLLWCGGTSDKPSEIKGQACSLGPLLIHCG